MPAISSGIFGYPIDRCVQIFSKTTREYIDSLEQVGVLKTIMMCNIESATVKKIREAFEQEFEQELKDSKAKEDKKEDAKDDQEDHKEEVKEEVAEQNPDAGKDKDELMLENKKIKEQLKEMQLKKDPQDPTISNTDPKAE